MENKINVVIVGYGNIGKYALEAVRASEDMQCVGVIRRSGSAEGAPELEGIPVAKTLEELGWKSRETAERGNGGLRVDVAILSVPSRKVKETALPYLKAGISTVDSFDIHSSIPALRSALGSVACQGGAVSVISAGWDPGSDSVVRTLLQALAPKGVTYTNFGPGRSMGHTVAAKAIPGVRNALSMTIPEGKGIHSRHVYIELEEGFEFEKVAAALKSDSYFASDETVVEQVPSVDALNTLEHGVNLVREGVCGETEGQKFEFNMRINNPALTGGALVMAARAAVRQRPGCYTLPEIAPIDFLPGSRDLWVAKLV